MSTPEGLARVLRTIPWRTTLGARGFAKAEFATPKWESSDRDAGLWKRDVADLWWGPNQF